MKYDKSEESYGNYDKLADMLAIQLELNERIQKKYNLPDFSDKDYWLRQYVLSMFSEIGELMESFNWKHWKRSKELNIDNIKEEAIDIQHFLNSIYLVLGMNADDVYAFYIHKNKENHERQDGKIKGREDYE